MNYNYEYWGAFFLICLWSGFVIALALPWMWTASVIIIAESIAGIYITLVK